MMKVIIDKTKICIDGKVIQNSAVNYEVIEKIVSAIILDECEVENKDKNLNPYFLLIESLRHNYKVNLEFKKEVDEFKNSYGKTC